MAPWTFWDFVTEQWKIVPPVANADLSGKAVLVIGANAGLGFEAAKHFAIMGPKRLILACRNHERGDSAIFQLEKATGYKNAELWTVDLGQFASVKQFADKFEKDGGRLDVVVANAATAPGSEYSATPDGWEPSLQVNHLSLSLLALLLIPGMLRTSKIHSTTPRLVFVSSNVHHHASIDKELIDSPSILKSLGSQEYCTPIVMRFRYPLTKLLNIFFVRALNDHLPLSAPTVTVNAVNPGFCYSELRRGITGLRAVMIRVREIALALTSEQGSRQLVWGAVGGIEKEEKMRGSYISSSEIVDPSDYVLSAQGKVVQERLWDEMIDILAEVDPRIQPIVANYLTDVASD